MDDIDYRYTRCSILYVECHVIHKISTLRNREKRSIAYDSSCT